MISCPISKPAYTTYNINVIDQIDYHSITQQCKNIATQCYFTGLGFAEDNSLKALTWLLLQVKWYDVSSFLTDYLSCKQPRIYIQAKKHTHYIQIDVHTCTHTLHMHTLSRVPVDINT